MLYRFHFVDNLKTIEIIHSHRLIFFCFFIRLLKIIKLVNKKIKMVRLR